MTRWGSPKVSQYLTFVLSSIPLARCQCTAKKKCLTPSWDFEPAVSSTEDDWEQSYITSSLSLFWQAVLGERDAFLIIFSERLRVGNHLISKICIYAIFCKKKTTTTRSNAGMNLKNTDQTFCLLLLTSKKNLKGEDRMSEKRRGDLLLIAPHCHCTAPAEGFAGVISQVPAFFPSFWSRHWSFPSPSLLEISMTWSSRFAEQRLQSYFNFSSVFFPSRMKGQTQKHIF